MHVRKQPRQPTMTSQYRKGGTSMTDRTAGAARGWPRRTIGALTVGLAPRTRSSQHFAAGMLANFGIGTLLPRTRSSHHIAAGTVANFGFKSGTRIIDFLVSFSIPKFAQKARQELANFGIGTLGDQRGADMQRVSGYSEFS